MRTLTLLSLIFIASNLHAQIMPPPPPPAGVEGGIGFTVLSLLAVFALAINRKTKIGYEKEE